LTLKLARSYTQGRVGLGFFQSIIGLPASQQVRSGDGLVDVRLSDGESFEGMLRRFSKRVQQEGVLSEARRREHFEPPSVVRKKRAAAKRRKSIKSTLKNQ